jgi:hypothetical protein
MSLFYRSLLWTTQLELALAYAQSPRNWSLIERLSADELDYQHRLFQLTH